MKVRGWPPVAAALLCVGGAACTPRPSADSTPPSVKQFIDAANQTMLRLGIEQGRAGWVQQNYITDDTEAMAARANQAYSDAVAKLAKEATRFDRAGAAADERRQLNLLKVSLVLATPSNPAESDEVTKIMARLE